MTRSSGQQAMPHDPLTVATDWFARKRSGAMTAAELAELDAWLEHDDTHRDAMAKAERMWTTTGFEAVRSDPRIIALRERGKAPRWRGLRRVSMIPAAAAACLAIVVGSTALLDAPTRPALFEPAIKQEFRTSVGQRTTVKLPDGSTVTLDTDTVLRTRETATRRYVELEKGQAFFKVARDVSRPFVVSAGGRTVTALGTAFSVKVHGKAFEVVLVEGKVRVDAPVRATPLALPTGRVQTTEMEAGSELAAVDARHWSVREVDAPKETAWLHGRLVYEGRPLAEVVADMNRYSDKKIVLQGDALGAKALSGTYRAGDVDEFVTALEDYGLAQVVSEGDEKITLASF